ncbi:MAG TPA: disulfide bond formation protein B [Limnobacter sp.]|nr:disulfide bond formation protein B [Limnobacter sp.]
MNKSNNGGLALLGAAICVAALAAAVYLQVSKGWFPCPLCIVQRYGYLLALAGFLGLACTAPRSMAGRFSGLLTLVGIGVGLATAAYHVWVLANPLQTCGVDPLQLKLNALPWVRVWPDMFVADGLCTDAYPPLLGLSLPMWSGLGFVALGVLFLQLVRRRRQFRRSW